MIVFTIALYSLLIQTLPVPEVKRARLRIAVPQFTMLRKLPACQQRRFPMFCGAPVTSGRTFRTRSGRGFSAGLQTQSSSQGLARASLAHDRSRGAGHHGWTFLRNRSTHRTAGRMHRLPDHFGRHSGGLCVRTRAGSRADSAPNRWIDRGAVPRRFARARGPARKSNSYSALDRVGRDTDFDSVSADNTAASREGTRHLISLGHRRIILLASDPSLRTSRNGFKDIAKPSGKQGFPRLKKSWWPGGMHRTPSVLS